MNRVDDQNANLVIRDLDGTRHVVASASDYISDNSRWGDNIYSHPMGDGHYVTVFSVLDGQNHTSSLFYRIFDASTGGFDGGKILGQSDDNWVWAGVRLEEPGRILLKDHIFSICV